VDPGLRRDDSQGLLKEAIQPEKPVRRIDHCRVRSIASPSGDDPADVAKGSEIVG